MNTHTHTHYCFHQLQGDVTIKLWHRSRHGNDSVILRCQIHTSAISGDVLTIEKHDLGK